MTPIELKKLRDKGRALEPLVRIGKNGINDATLLHIKKLVDARKLVKVKLLRSFLESSDRKEAAEKIAEGTGSELIDLVGFVVVIYKR